MNLTNESTIADIAARFNQLNGSTTDVKALAKRGKAKLLARIAELEATEAAAAKALKAKTSRMAAAVKSMEAANGKAGPTKRVKEPAKPKAKVEKKKKAPGAATIRSVSEALLLEVVSRDEDKRPYGYAYDEILDRIRVEFPEAKTTPACLRWYAVHMRERGEKVPNRPRVQPVKKGE